MGMREGSDPLALSRGTGIRGSLLLLFLPTNSLPRMREGSDPLALSRGTAIRGSCFFRFFSRTRLRGSERVPTLSRSPVGLRFAAPTSFVSSNRLTAEDARGFRPSRALPWDCDSRLLLLSFLLTNSPPGEREGSDPLALSHGDCNSWLLAALVSSHELAAGDARGFRPSRALPWGCDSRLLLLSFLRTNSPPGMREGSNPLALSRGTAIRGSLLLLFLPTNSPPRMREGSDPLALSRGAGIRGSYFFCFFEQTRRRGMREGSDPLALSRGGRDSRLSTSFASPFVSPYSSGMRTVSDWGGTVTAVDSFWGCAESRFAERKSVWVTASGSVTRISRSAERLYTR